MADEYVRRSDRVSVELPIQISGTDALGEAFLINGRTVVVSRHGAKILLARKLAPEQELTIQCVRSGQEADARVVGQIGEGPEGFFYGVSFLDSKANPWGIDFPPLSEAEQAVGRMVLECVRCHTRELVYLDRVELEVLESNQSLSRHCKRCADTSLWKKSFAEVPGPGVSSSAAAAGAERRREPRRALRVTACVRSLEFGEELVWTRDVSRGGLCFESKRKYMRGWQIEVAVPYTLGGGNIFLRGRIAYACELPSAGASLYGVCYTRNSGN